MLDRRIVNSVTSSSKIYWRIPLTHMFDLIICRNVLIYFTEEAKASLYRKFNEALSPGGFFIRWKHGTDLHSSQFGFQSEDLFLPKVQLNGMTPAIGHPVF